MVFDCRGGPPPPMPPARQRDEEVREWLRSLRLKGVTSRLPSSSATRSVTGVTLRPHDSLVGAHRWDEETEDREPWRRARM